MIGSNTVNYIEFGSGKKTLIILPGLGDGLFPLHGKIQAIAFAFRYKQFAKDYKVYVFSRKNQITEKYSTRDEKTWNYESRSNGCFSRWNDSSISGN